MNEPIFQTGGKGRLLAYLAAFALFFTIGHWAVHLF